MADDDCYPPTGLPGQQETLDALRECWTAAKRDAVLALERRKPAAVTAALARMTRAELQWRDEDRDTQAFVRSMGDGDVAG